MISRQSTQDIEDLILQVDASGAPIRLEYVHGQACWEASPVLLHQRIINKIRHAVAHVGRR